MGSFRKSGHGAYSLKVPNPSTKSTKPVHLSALSERPRARKAHTTSTAKGSHPMYMPHSCHPHWLTGAGRDPKSWSRLVSKVKNPLKSSTSGESVSRGKRDSESITGNSFAAENPRPIKPTTMQRTSGTNVRRVIERRIE